MTFHRGSPKNLGSLRFVTAFLGTKDKSHWIEHSVIHPLKSWFGFTFKDKWFVGVMIFAPRAYGDIKVTREEADETYRIHGVGTTEDAE